MTDAIKPQLEAKGYKVKLVEFTDYVTPMSPWRTGRLTSTSAFSQQSPIWRASPKTGVSGAHHPGADRSHGALRHASWGSEAVKGKRSRHPRTIPPTRREHCTMLQDLGWLSLREDQSPQGEQSSTW